MQLRYRLPALLCFCGLTAAASPLLNGSFEKGAPGKTPESWNFVDSKAPSGAQMTVDERGASDGRRSLLIRNPSPKRPNVFGSLCQAVPLEAGKRYRLSCDISGAPTQGLAFVIGSRWNVRLHPGTPASSGGWRHFSKEFTLKPEDLDAKGYAVIRIISQDVSEGTRLDNLRIDPAGGAALAPGAFQSARMLPAKRVNAPPAAGIPENFPCITLPSGPGRSTAKTFPSAANLKARFAFGFDDEGLLFFADVRDDRLLGGSGGDMWKNDSVQLRLSPEGSFSGDCPATDFELGFSPAASGISTWNWRDERPLSAAEAELAGGPVPGGYRFAAHLKWELFAATPEFRNARAFTFNVIVNDSDAPGHRDVAFLEDGIHHRKSDRLNTLVMKEDGAPLAVLAAESFRDPRVLRGTLFLSGVEQAEEWELTAEFTGSDGKQVRIPFRNLPPVRAGEIVRSEAAFPLTALADGSFKLRFLLNGNEIGSVDGSRADLLKQQLAFLSEAEKRFTRLAQDPNIPKSRYLGLPEAVLRRQIAMHRANLTARQSAESLEFRLRTGEVVTRELGLALDGFEAALALPLPPPARMYRTSPVESYRGGLPVVETAAEDGSIRREPHFFIGYGHFEQVIRDLDYLPEVAANVIQIELGPHHIFPEENFRNPSDAVYRRRLETAFELAAKNNMKIALLLSPHYHPKWWLEAHPELAQANGMYKYDVNSPEAREMVTRFLDWLLPKLRDGVRRNVLHSIVLANEPVYRGAKWSSPRTRELFGEWLKQEFGTVAEFNRVSGKSFPDFGAVLASSPADPAVNYAFNRFRRETFAAFHRMIGDKVKEYLPDMPVSVKIMMAELITPAGVEDCVDPELFAEFSDYNGNDNYMIHGEGPFISSWVQTAFGHDLQYSLKPVRILNSENHIIRDGESRFIPPEHIYTAVFEQLLQGVGGIVSWVWAENDYANYKRRGDTDGCIYHRPAAIIAHGRAALDGNRLAGPISEFVEAPPEIALVYAPSSHIQNPGDYTATLRNTYTTLAFTGRKTGFISEKQLAAKKFGKLKVIVLTDATHLDAAAAAALAEFTRKGGKLFIVGAPPAFDSWGAPLKLRPDGERVKNAMPPGGAARFWQKRLSALLPTPFELEQSGNRDNTGILFRAVPAAGGGQLVNIVNYNREPRKLKLTGKGTFTDLVAGKPFAPEFELAPLAPLFLSFQPE